MKLALLVFACCCLWFEVMTPGQKKEVERFLCKAFLSMVTEEKPKDSSLFGTWNFK